MEPTQKYSLAEIKGCIDFLRNDKKISQEKIEGMDILADSIDDFKQYNDLSETEKSAMRRKAHRELAGERAIEKMAAQKEKEARKKKKLEKIGK
jgi:hypothetical protein